MPKYFCELCNFCTINKTGYARHIKTKKHKRKENAKYFCEKCNKHYKDKSGLWRHKKKCCLQEELLPEENLDTIKNMIIELLKTNNNNNIINNDNRTFNLNVFLNETCKDALNISDFVSSIHVGLEDLEHTGRNGYVQGISNIFVKNLKSITQNLRPIHCSDKKREVLYVKENDKWERETEEKPILIRAIKNIANENIKQIQHWQNQYPDCIYSDSRKNDLYLKIVRNSMNGSTDEEMRRNLDKIISNVVKETVIDKEVNRII
jgi:hypothetical protein